MIGGSAIAFAGLSLQSAGEVLYGTFLHGVPAPLFVLLSVCLTAFVFLAATRFRLPRGGRSLILEANLWTAACFVSFYFALKHLPPAVCTAIEIGASLLAAIVLTRVEGPRWSRGARYLACAGIAAGCGLLAWIELRDATSGVSPALAWAAIGAAAATGVASALFAGVSRKLGGAGWSCGAVLAHRFHLSIAAALAWMLWEGLPPALPSPAELALVPAIGAVAVLAPLLLFQMALRRIDALTFLICLAAQPLLSFGLSSASPRYGFDAMTLAGILVVTLFLALDLAARARLRPA